MSGTFLHQLYAELNGDLAETFGADAVDELRNHYLRYGVNEVRGASVGEHFNLEGMLISDGGFVLLIGWADLRVLKSLNFTVDMGFLSYEITDPSIAWYHRPDVADAVGDAENPCGFVALFQIDQAVIHPRVTIKVNGHVVRQESTVRFLSVQKFLNTALATCGVLADMPVGHSLKSACLLFPVFEQLWYDYLDSLAFAHALQRRQHDHVERSIIITVYKRADMLMRQLEELAPYLVSSKTEVIVVGNELIGSQATLSAINAFCQIHPIDISVYLCSGNSGFSVANNYGAEQARGDVLVFMNPDVFPPEESFEQAVAFLESDPGQALHGAMLYYGDGMLMHSGMYATYDWVASRSSEDVARVLRVEHFGKGLSHWVDDDEMDWVFEHVDENRAMVSAALWKVRKSVFDAAGGLPIDYLFAYYEDADFCLRFLESGGEIVIDKSSRWLHLEGVGKAKPPAVRTFMWLNRARFTDRFGDSELLVDPEGDQTIL